MRGTAPGVSSVNWLNCRPFNGRSTMAAWATTSLGGADVVLMAVTTPVTLTVCVVEETAILKFTLALWFTSSNTPFWLAVANPLLLTNTSYTPGGSWGTV